MTHYIIYIYICMEIHQNILLIDIKLCYSETYFAAWGRLSAVKNFLLRSGRQQVHGQVMTDTAELRKPEHTQTLCLSLTISRHLHCYILESKQSSSFFIQCQSDGFGKCCSLLLRLEEPSNYISLISLAYFCLSLQQINSMDCVSFVYCFI